MLNVAQETLLSTNGIVVLSDAAIVQETADVWLSLIDRLNAAAALVSLITQPSLISHFSSLPIKRV